MNNDFLCGEHDTDNGTLLVWFEVSRMQCCVGVMVKARFSVNKCDWLSDSESVAVGEAAKRCVNVTPLHAWLHFLAASMGVISCTDAQKICSRELATLQLCKLELSTVWLHLTHV